MSAGLSARRGSGPTISKRFCVFYIRLPRCVASRYFSRCSTIVATPRNRRIGMGGFFTCDRSVTRSEEKCNNVSNGILSSRRCIVGRSWHVDEAFQLNLNNLFWYEFLIPVPKRGAYPIQLIGAVENFGSGYRLVRINSDDFQLPFLLEFFDLRIGHREGWPNLVSTLWEKNENQFDIWLFENL